MYLYWFQNRILVQIIFFTADAICNCPIPSGLNPYGGSTITTTKNLNIQDSDLKINQTYPFSLISNGSSMDTGENLYSTIVSYKNCDITWVSNKNHWVSSIKK